MNLKVGTTFEYIKGLYANTQSHSCVLIYISILTNIALIFLWIFFFTFLIVSYI